MKFLTDAQIRLPFVRMLRQLGHEVVTVYEENLGGEKFDYKLVAHARTLSAVFLTCDYLRGQSGLEVAQEIAVNGGKVVRIGGGPHQPDEKALGRLLFHWPEWCPKLEKHDGLVDIMDIKQAIVSYTRHNIRSRVRRLHQPAFDEYLRERGKARRRPLKRHRRQKITLQQSKLDITNGAA